MKKQLFTAFIVSLFSLCTACNSIESKEKQSTLSVDQSNNQEISTAETAKKYNSNHLEIGYITEIQQGALQCYLELMDKDGNTYSAGATFDICYQSESENLLNQKSKFIYTLETVHDCQSNEPCGKTRQEYLISEVVLLEAQ